MQKSGKAYLNGKPVDFSEFWVAPDFIREFITTHTDNAPTPTPETGTEGDETTDTHQPR